MSDIQNTLKRSTSRLFAATATGVFLIVAATFTVYWPSLRGGFILDDDLYVYKNGFIQAPDGLRKFWLSKDAPDYWPLSNTTLWIEWRLWGMQTTGYHVTNVLLHIIAAMLLWRILDRLRIPGAYLAALLFAVHPVNVESIAWIAQRKDALAVVFFLLSILWFTKAVSQSRSLSTWYFLSLFSFILAMLSKGSVAILPLALVMLVWWRNGGRVSWRQLAWLTPFFVIAAVLTKVNIWFQTHGQPGAMRDAEFMERLLGAGAVIWFYLYKALLPMNLLFIYPMWEVRVSNLLWWIPLAATIGVTVGLIGLWNLRRNRLSEACLVAWGFFCISLIPVMGFADIGFMQHSLVADHYQHIAIMSVVAFLAAGWAKWYGNTRRGAHLFPLAIAIIGVGAALVLSWQQAALYKDGITLYAATLEQNPDAWLARGNLAKELSSAGKIIEALDHAERAIRVRSDVPDTQALVGDLLAKLDRVQEAIEHYELSRRLNPKVADVQNNLGYLLLNAGRTTEAMECFKQAMTIKPDYAEAYFNLGNALIKAGNPLEAVQQFAQALKIKPDFAEAHYGMGNAFNAAGRDLDATVQYQLAIQIKSNFPQAYYRRANILNESGKFLEAISDYERAIQLNPDYTVAYANVAIAYARAGRNSEAITAAQKAIGFAQSTGQSALAIKIQQWLTNYQNSQASGPGALPPSLPSP